MSDRNLESPVVLAATTPILVLVGCARAVRCGRARRVGLLRGAPPAQLVKGRGGKIE